jgi:prepilin-type N-terminal cleavage/methylation domain-containing protein
MALKYNHGFTIVELVVVILITGIILAAASPRFASSKAYDQAIIQNRILSIARSAQLGAFGRSAVTLSLTSDGAAARVQSGGLGQAAGQEIQVSELVLGAGVMASIGTNPCAPINAGNPLTISFNSDAEIDQNMGIQVCLDGVETVCVSPAGFAHVGACE